MDDWQAWAASNGIDQVVRSYATFVGASEFVPEFNPAEQIHAVPRTWAAVSDELQALCFFAGANSIFTGEKLLTTPGPGLDHDQWLLQSLGMRVEGAAVRA